MTANTAPHRPVENWQQERDAWVGEVERLASDVQRWSEARGWAVRRDAKPVTEDGIGSYQVPVLTILTFIGRVVFDPVARFIVGASGRIELYAFPSFAQVVLVRRNGEWRFLSDADMSDLNRAWNEADFVRTVEELQASQ